MYTRNRSLNFKQETRFQLREVKPIGYQFGMLICGKQPSIPFGMRAPRNPLDGYAKAASNNFNTGG
jgi:hypothetical protein